MNMTQPGQSIASDYVRLRDSTTRGVATADQDHPAPDAKRLSASFAVARVPDSSGLGGGPESSRWSPQCEWASTALAQGR